MGVVVLATTNHPEKLDTAILDRPSRFDRKYFFDLPSADDRQQYIERWNGQLEVELRVSEVAAVKLVQQTEGFSFAYMKELYLSSMSQWMATQGKESMDEIILTQSHVLSRHVTLQ
jgi:ATP-dependent 26S proteasome regulatory subunit